MQNYIREDSQVLASSSLGFFVGAGKANVFLLIQMAFSELPQTLNMQLREVIILNYISQAIDNIAKHGQLVWRDLQVAPDLDLNQKLGHLLNLRQLYYASPVITSHPTEIFSDEVMALLDHLVYVSLKYQKTKIGSDVSVKLASRIRDLVKQFSVMRLMPEDNLTPHQEMLRQDRLYLDMMESWSRFNTRYIKHFAQFHGVAVDAIRDVLTDMNKISYQNVSSWAVADIDGNKKRNRQTMEKMEAGLQISIITRYIERVESLMTSTPELKSVLDYLCRCRKAISDGIFFNQKGAGVAKKRLIKILESCLDTLSLDKDTRAKLIQLKDLVDLVGFRGELKQFVRQSSKANADVFDNFLSILKKNFPQVQKLASTYQHYSDWEVGHKEALHHLFRMDSSYFKAIKLDESLLTPDTIRELDILEFVIEYQDQFSYILSDTENYTSLNEVTILFGFAAYRKGRLCIDEIRRPPVNLIPLCETPDDLANLTNIIDQMLSNPYLKEVIISRGELIYVAGPSDLGKEGGIFAHIELIEAEKNVQRILESHQKLDESLKGVQLRVLYGLGGDVHRRVSDAFSQLFCTFQGSDACRLASFGSFQAYVEQVSGKPSENSVRARELALLEQDNPASYGLLKQLISHQVRAYRNFIYHPGGLELFRQLSMPYHLGVLTNTSSRGESKNSAPKDITKSRAIGITNYDMSTLLMLRIIMSADGLAELSDEIKKEMPKFYEMSSVVREQVLKIFYAIAVCDEKRALNKIFKDLPSQEALKHLAKGFVQCEEANVEQALAYVVCRIPVIIDAVVYFLPENLQIKARSYMLSHGRIESNASLVLGLLEKLGEEELIYKKLHQELRDDLLPRYQRLKICLDSYLELKDSVTPEEQSVLQENVILALRGDKRVIAGPLAISQMRSSTVLTPEFAQDQVLKAKL